MATGSPPPGGAPAGWSPVGAPAKKKGAGPTVALVVVILLILGAAAYIITRDGGGDSLPATFLGQPKLDSPEAQQLEDEISSQVPAGVAVLGGMYGTETAPAYVLFVYEEPASLSFDEEWNLFSDGFTGEAGAYQAGSQVDADVNGDQARCAVSGDGAASVCVWGGGTSYKALVLIGESDGSAAMDQVRQAQPVLKDINP